MAEQPTRKGTLHEAAHKADVEPDDTFVNGHGILEAHAAGLHRYVRDRARGPARALAALARRAPDPNK